MTHCDLGNGTSLSPLPGMRNFCFALRTCTPCAAGGWGARVPIYEMPTVLSMADTGKFLRCSLDGLCVDYTGLARDEKDAASIRANKSIPDSGLALYYFEMTVHKEGALGRIAIGLSCKDAKLEKLPGCMSRSYGYHALDGHIYNSSSGYGGDEYGSKYGQGDVVGCCWDMINNVLFFTRNGVSMGTAFENIPGSLYPTIGMQSKGGRVSVNFGSSPFVFNVDGYAGEQRGQLISSVLATRLPDTKKVLANYVLDYLIHAGYSESADAFARSLGQTQDNVTKSSSDDDSDRAEQTSFVSRVDPCSSPVANGRIGGGSDLSLSYLSENACSSSSIRRRQAIMMKVMSGDTETALVDAAEHFPGFRFVDRHTEFMVKSQQFIELLLAGKKPVEDVAQFGKDELFPFQDCFSEQLEEVISLLAYKDPRDSPIKHLVSLNRRQIVADSLNAAILVTLNFPARSMMERVLLHSQLMFKVYSEVANGALAMLSGVEDLY